MASANVITRPTPAQIARATAAAIPSEISTRPLLGIVGVLIGAGLVTLTGRMLSLGLADLRGHVGISFDHGAWFDSAYNAAIMFIGPFSVYLGGLLGPRRVLLFAAGVFTVTCAFLPFIHSYSLLIAALIVAGLSSGTFYPLTLTFALRITPLRFLPFTMAFYATFIDGAVNVAPSLYGWYREHLSWHWMFWNSAVIAPVMMICIYFGIPPAPARKKDAPVPSFVGFLYLSAGLALMLTAIQQGQRLDWWRSGVFTRAILVRCVLHTMRAHTTTMRSQPSGSAPLSLAMEHSTTGHAAVLVSVYSHEYHHHGSAVARHSRLRSRPDRAGRDLERCSPPADYVYRCAPDASETRPSSVAGRGLDLHRLRRLLEC